MFGSEERTDKAKNLLVIFSENANGKRKKMERKQGNSGREQKKRSGTIPATLLRNPENQRRKKHVKVFHGIVLGFSGDFVLCVFLPHKDPPKQINTCLPPTQSRDNPQNFLCLCVFLCLISVSKLVQKRTVLAG